jgi:hypothetical protein
MKTLNDIACILNRYSNQMNTNEMQIGGKGIENLLLNIVLDFFLKHTNSKRHPSTPRYLRMG